MILPPPIIYEPTTSLSEQISFDQYDFGKLLFIGSKESIILDHFEFLGGKITDKGDVEMFLKENSFVSDNLSIVINRLKDLFENDGLNLKISQIDGEVPELFLIIETKKNLEEVSEYLKDFDKWFVPNIFMFFTRFNISVNFI